MEDINHNFNWEWLPFQIYGVLKLILRTCQESEPLRRNLAPAKYWKIPGRGYGVYTAPYIRRSAIIEEGITHSANLPLIDESFSIFHLKDGELAAGHADSNDSHYCHLVDVMFLACLQDSDPRWENRYLNILNCFLKDISFGIIGFNFWMNLLISDRPKFFYTST